MNNNNEEKKEDLKETFCPVCIAAVPLAFSVTSGAVASNSIEEKQKRHQIIKWCTITGIISLFFILYFMFVVKCDSCA